MYILNYIIYRTFVLIEVTMNLDDYNTLNDILIELKQDRYYLEEKVKKNLSDIRETEIYVESFKTTDSDDIKVFSPRNKEILYKDEIEKAELKKSDCIKENAGYNKKIDILTSRINRIESILENESGNFTILSIQEEDRKRIARDLHDTSLQNLTHLIHQIELSGLYIDQDPIQAKLELSLVNKKIREIIDEIRNTIFNLRPMTFDDLGLKAVFERLADSINEDKQYEIELDVEDVSCETNIILVTIYRVVHECLNNIVKHAEATKISLSCRCIENNCHIVISDNGKGFSDMTDDGTKHFGIFCMKERIKLLGGKIYIDSSPEWGTTISINVPLNVHIN